MLTSQSKVEELSKLYEIQLKRLHEEYFTFLRFESVSTEPEFKDRLLQCADWVKEFLSDMGMKVDIWETSGHPTIFATYDGAGPDKPTLLIYNHYDVQPVDPLNEWTSAPFHPSVRENEVFARGAQDNKGQCFYTIAALRALLQRDGSLPVNIKLCIEGEEEAGSAGLLELATHKREELQADFLAIIDCCIQKADEPSLSLGARGLVSLEVEIVGSETDLHSGSHGGIVYNPIHALAEIVAKLRDSSGKILVPGFYDGIEEFTKEERDRLNFDFNEKVYGEDFGAEPVGGESEFTPLESCWLRPTLEVNGFGGGYTGDGFKTVIPAKASAKISCRLVPGQDPQRVGALVKDYLESLPLKGVKMNVVVHAGGGCAIRTSPNSRIVQAAAQAYGDVFAKQCKFTLEGGSIPITAALAEASGAEILFMGYGLHSDQIHAPNEHFGLDRLKKGFLTVGRLLQILAE